METAHATQALTDVGPFHGEVEKKTKKRLKKSLSKDEFSLETQETALARQKTVREIFSQTVGDIELELGLPSDMTNDELAAVVIDGMQKFRKFIPYVVELHKRFNDGERDSSNRLQTPIRDCRTFAEFCINRCFRQPSTIYAAMRDVLKKEKKIGSGEKKTKKPAVTIVVKDGVSKEVLAIAVAETKDAIFESGRRAERMVQEKHAAEAEANGTEDEVHVLEALKFADTFARNIAVAVNASGKVNDVKAVKAARKAAVLYCKLRGISFLVEATEEAAAPSYFESSAVQE